MDTIVVEGGRALEGDVDVSGAKNAALPLLFSTLLTGERCVIRNVPRVADGGRGSAGLRHLGAKVSTGPDGREVIVEASDIGTTEAPYDLVKTMRASFLVPRPRPPRLWEADV